MGLLLQAAKLQDAKERTRLYGSQPRNPFAELRFANDLSINELSDLSNIDRKALSRMEQGLYVNPLPALIRYWVYRAQSTEGYLLESYRDFQDQQRSRHPKFFGATLDKQACLTREEHPFRVLRNNRPHLVTGVPFPVGLVECCAALCLPLDTIQFFEKKYQRQQSLPKVLFNTLNQIGYSRDEVLAFEKKYQDWRMAQQRLQVTFS